MSERRWAILKRGAYEGFERPTLGDEVPADVREQARELTEARDIRGVRRILVHLAHDGIDGYDIVALGGFPGSGWTFLGFDVAVGERSALLEHAPDGRNEHGLFWEEDEARAFAEAIGGGELVPVQHFRRSALRPGDRIYYTTGNEHSPSDRHGRIKLTIDDADGAASIELFRPGGYGAWVGQVDPAAIKRIRSALAASIFPEMQREGVPPGSIMRELEVVTDEQPQYTQVSEDFGDGHDGYREAFALLEQIAAQLTGGVYQRKPDTGETLVTGARPA